MSKSIKLGVTISVGALILLISGALVGILLYRHFTRTPDNASQTQNTGVPDLQLPYQQEWAAKFATLTPEEKLRKRLAGVEGANKRATNGCILVLSGPNQDIITVTAPLQSYSNEIATSSAKGFIEGFLPDEQTIKEMIALEVTAIVVTDGKRSWTRDLKTGSLTTKVVE